MSKIIGIDEVGLGAIAGPLVVAGVVLEEGATIAEVVDSTQLKPEQRVNLIPQIHQASLYWVVVQASPEKIDEYGVQACLAQCQIVCAQNALAVYPEAKIIIDGNKPIGPPIPRAIQRAIPKADATVQAVGAASVLAKVYRDTVMASLSLLWPRYGFETHRGYPTPTHLRQLALYGVCGAHRRSYAPVRKALEEGAASRGRLTNHDDAQDPTPR